MHSWWECKFLQPFGLAFPLLGMASREVGYVYTMEYYSAFKNEGSSDTCYDTDESRSQHAKPNKPATEMTALI